MSDYPECDKLAEASKLTQPIGEFLDWLTSQGICLMTWRDDLTDTRPTDRECSVRVSTNGPLPCDPGSRDEPGEGEPLAYWRRHCKHFSDPHRPASSPARQGHCCRCGRDRFYEVTGLKAWVSDPRNYEQLLADWAGVDLKKVEAERRQILTALREANAAREG